MRKEDRVNAERQRERGQEQQPGRTPRQPEPERKRERVRSVGSQEPSDKRGGGRKLPLPD